MGGCANQHPDRVPLIARVERGLEAMGAPAVVPCPRVNHCLLAAVRADLVCAIGAGTGVNVYVLDTGIRSTHDEFRQLSGGGTRVQPGFSGLWRAQQIN